jgi:hypothetical protein
METCHKLKNPTQNYMFFIPNDYFFVNYFLQLTAITVFIKAPTPDRPIDSGTQTKSLYYQ